MSARVKKEHLMILAVPDQLERAMWAGRSEKVASLMRIPHMREHHV